MRIFSSGTIGVLSAAGLALLLHSAPASAQQQHSISVSWSIPAYRADGTLQPIDELGGYTLEYYPVGNSAGGVPVPLGEPVSVMIEDPSTTEYIVEGLIAGDYAISIASFDVLGRASEFASPVQITVEDNTTEDSANNDPNANEGSSGSGANDSGDANDASGAGTGTGANDASGTGSGTGANEDIDLNETGGSLVAQVSWHIPTERADGQSLSLTDIGGYEVRYRMTYGPSGESMAGEAEEQSLIVEDAQQTETVIYGLLPGEYAFTIAAFDTAGRYSLFTDPQLIILQGN